MRFLSTVGFIFRLMLLVSLGVLYQQRQAVSGAYWLIQSKNGNNRTSTPIFRMLPDGRGRFAFAEDIALWEIYWLSDPSKFLYSYELDDTHYLELVNVRTSERKILFSQYVESDSSTIIQYHRSPNGKSEIVQIIGPGEDRLMITSSDGANLTTIMRQNDIKGSIFDVSWSEDGQWIYFTSPIEYQNVRYQIRPDGTDLTVIHEQYNLNFTLWSDSGDTLVGLNNRHIYLMNVDGSNSRPLLADYEFEGEMAMGLYNGSVIFRARNEAGIAWYMRQFSGGEVVQLTDYFPLEYEYQTFSQHQNWCTAIMRTETNVALYQINLDTGERRQFTPFANSLSEPSVTSDNRWIFFAGRFHDSESVGVYRIQADGTDLELIYTVPDGQCSATTFSPDQRWLMIGCPAYYQFNLRSVVRVKLSDGHIERLPDGSVPLASPLIDLEWNFGRLMRIGGILIGLAVGTGIKFYIVSNQLS